MTDCNKTQANNLACNEISLTEQWKKGELPCGWYYIKIADIVFIDFFEGKAWKNKKDENIDEVLEPVPSYRNWDKLNNVCHELEKETACLTVDMVNFKERLKKTQELELEVRRENTKLKTENKWYSEQLNEAVKKIDKLKEQQKLTTDCRTLAQKLLQVKPELRDWLEVNYGEYL